VLRHANVSTTTSCYIKTSPPDARAAMRKLEISLADTYRTPEAQTGKTPQSI
jgi:hypothetical protein